MKELQIFASQGQTYSLTTDSQIKKNYQPSPAHQCEQLNNESCNSIKLYRLWVLKLAVHCTAACAIVNYSANAQLNTNKHSVYNRIVSNNEQNNY